MTRTSKWVYFIHSFIHLDKSTNSLPCIAPAQELFHWHFRPSHHISQYKTRMHPGDACNLCDFMQ